VSAYFCQDSTFHLIATYAATIDATADLKTVWRQLIQENLKSLNTLYPHHQASNVEEARDALAAISDRPALPLPEPGIIKSAIREYEYQSDKAPNYLTGNVSGLMLRLLATIDAPAAVSPDGGWYDTDTIETPQPAPPTPAPGADPIEAARASLLAAFNAPAAPEPEPEPEPDKLETIAPEAKTRALVVLLTLARLANGSADAERFQTLANRIGNSLDTTRRADASTEAARNVAAVNAVWVAA
jgi:hypothetical protein